MILQEAIDYTEYYRCYVVGQKDVHVMPYEPRNPHHLRYEASFKPDKKIANAMHKYCLQIMSSLGYQCNSIEFAIRDGVPYAIDYLNAAPDAELSSVQQDNFDWFVEHMASFLIQEVRKGRYIPREYSWSDFMNPKVSIS